MARVIQITVPDNRTDELLAEMRQADWVAGLQVHRGISLQPPGDVISILVTNRQFIPLNRRLIALGIAVEPGTSLVTTEPASVLTRASRDALMTDDTEASWEEMEFMLARESHATLNTLVLMGVSGAIAAVGLATNALHLVAGAMVIAPGFEPILRVALGLLNRTRALRRGLYDFALGYGVMLISAGVAAGLYRFWGHAAVGADPSYVGSHELIRYWSRFTPHSFVLSALASIAGAVLVSCHRSVLTAGVMLSLALVPSATLAAVGVVQGRPDLAGKGLLRWGLEVVIVLVCASGVFAYKRFFVQRRRSVL